MSKIMDLLGRKFGRLTVISRAESKGGKAYWNCQCDCGKETVVYGSYLRTGHTKSCGCYNEDKKIKHKMYGTPEYRSWNHMLQRCNNKNSHKYSDYGGRGIVVCEKWLAFENFFADMGQRPHGKTLERIDVNGNYEPSNCKWATATEQQRNQRIQRNNSSGVKGVSWDKSKGKWTAQISVNYKNIYIGRFSSLQEAALARKRAEEKYWGKSS